MSAQKRRAKAVKRRVWVHDYLTRLLAGGRLTGDQIRDYYERGIFK